MGDRYLESGGIRPRSRSALWRCRGSPQLIDGSHVEHAKPAPDLLILAAQKLETRPNACWYVGDSTWDMRAAIAAGMVAVGVAYGARPTPSFSAQAPTW